MSARSVSVRPPAVAGTFYPADPSELRRLIAWSFDNALPAAPGAHEPLAIIAPHAGYVYSGPIAATAYQRVAAVRSRIQRVLLLGPSHRVPLRGLALSSADTWKTPAGPVQLDTDTTSTLERLPQVTVDDAAHATEHSLEVHLPFLIEVLDDFLLVPVAVGTSTPNDVAAVIDAAWTDQSTLLVVSTDLSHYLAYREAQIRDTRTAESIVALDFEQIHDRDACGAHPLRGMLKAVADRHLTMEQLDVRNSGDTAGDRSRVVGYGAFAVV